ncbi:hypothetical protein GOBAR_AA21991 [Gossypium barbadense]|uniref:Tyrosine specific protein phosphatases domain-containing protein n=3 Tax=Gossypium TaxID=3633 RepID=A0A2P5X5Q5_GOSBA|nr:hypothetical protein GOBAR_AA21991 [Gossypium barbadense]
MSTINSTACFSSVFLNPSQTELFPANFKCRFNFMLPKKQSKMGAPRIFCNLAETETGIDDNPRNSKVSVRSKSRMEEYNTAMKKMMRNPYEYHHDLGMNYTLITDNLIVGSQPQKPEDIDHLKQEEKVAYILNLQDFDPDSLRNILPKAVSSLEWAIAEGKGRVYVHCTAGLGRAPAVAIAYMFWFCGMNLNTAFEALTSKRPCGPNKRAIRGATYDLAKNDPWKEPFENLPEHAFEGVADWERKLIQDRVHSLRGT